MGWVRCVLVAVLSRRAQAVLAAWEADRWLGPALLWRGDLH